MILAKLSTAKTVSFGPVLDSTGAEYTGAAVGDVKICKNNGTPAALNVSATLTHKEVGMYELALTTSDVSEVGVLTVQLSKTTYVAPPVSLNVLPAVVYDAMVGGTDTLQVDLTQVLGTALTETSAGYLAAGLKKVFDIASPVFTAASVNQTGDSFARIGATGSGLTAIGDTRLANLDATVSSRHASGAAVAKSPATLDWSADVTNKPTIGTSTLTTTDIDNRLAAWGKTDFALSATTGWGGSALPTAFSANNLPSKYSANFDWSDVANKPTIGTSTFNPATDTVARVTLVDTCTTNTDMRGTNGAYTGTPPTADAIGTDAASKVLATPAYKLATNASGYVTYANAAPPSAATIASQVVSSLGTGSTLTACLTATGFSTHSANDVKTAMEANGSKLDHLWEMTEDDGGVRRFTANALEQAPAGGGGGDATAANQTTIITHLTDIKGTGFVKDTHSLPQCLTATGFSTHSANDVVTAMGTGSFLAAIPWNAAWDAEVQSECTDALNAYDPPTNAEMVARTLVSASYATAASVADAVWDEILSGHTVSGSAAQALSAAGGAADPLLNEVPGTYADGTAGFYIAKLAQILQQTGLITSSTAMTIVSSVITGSRLTLIAGNSYLAANGKALQIALPATPTDATSTASLAISLKPSPGAVAATQLLVATGVFVQVGSTWYAQFDLTAADTTLTAGTTYTAERLWDLAEITPSGDTVAIYSASPCTVTTLLDRT